MLPLTSTAVSLFGASLAPVAPDPSTGQEPGSVAGAASALSAARGLIPPVPAGTAAAPAPFADLLTEAVGEVQHLEVQAKGAIEGLISGKGVDVHEAMIAAQKAGMGFELMLAVRNKALAAYQQVLGMQF
jgi:flagellar hook-basal body complex protein FliE